MERFVEVYNDIEKYPTLTDVAVNLGVSYQTVRNYSCILRAKKRAGQEVPELISRVVTAKKADNDNLASARDHAVARADKLREEVRGLIQGSRYPVVNPEAIVVESYLRSVYDRINQIHVEKEGTPRTWINDTLRVEGVEDPRGRRFIFTGAQNDAEIHEGFWENLQAYAAYLDADIVVGPWTYETQWWSENNPTSRVYANALSEYMCFGQMAIGPNFIFAGEMNTLPTASRPISDLVTYSRGKWAVFPHAKIQLKSVPSTDPARQAHQVMTTGAVTRPKVIPRKAGVKSVFHHVIGATVVTFDQDGDFFCRQLNADETDGSFYDLDLLVKDGKVTGGHRVKAIAFGDIHRAKLGPVSTLATFGVDIRTGKKVKNDSIIDVLNPEETFYHDLFDNMARSHWTEHDNAYNYEIATRKRESVFGEIEQAADFLIQTARPGTRQFVVDSNHDLALERYVREGRYRCDGENIRFGLKLEDAYLGYREKVAHCLENYEATPTFSLLEYAVKLLKGSAVTAEWVHDGRSHLVDGVEYGNHGFRGANGARGSVPNFANMGRKITIGHIHSPEIMDGVYCVGVMELQHGYNKGPSSWATTHCIQYANGKRCLVTLQNGKWRA
jgi:hypothetical protein